MRVITSSLVVLLLVAAAATTNAWTSKQLDVSGEAMRQWLCEGDQACVREGFPKLTKKLAYKISHSVHEFFHTEGHPEHLVKAKGHPKPTNLNEAMAYFKLLSAESKKHKTRVGANQNHSYFGFIPNVDALVIPGGSVASYSTPCYGNVKVGAAWTTSSKITITINATNQKSLLCTDHLMISSLGGIKFQSVDWDKMWQVEIDLPTATIMNPAAMWYINNHGVAVMRFNKPFLDCIDDLVQTVILMAGFAEAPLTPDTFTANVDFLNNYQEVAAVMQPYTVLRAAGASVAENIDTSNFKSGDALFVQRPDGLDPMIGWAEGGTPGHTTIAMRDSNNTLHICESTANDSYWPRNGIQCHKWEDWWPLAAAAQFNVVLLPLAKEISDAFNVSAAWDYFHQWEGFDYGYNTMLMGWLDVPTLNGPCLPPKFETCLSDPLMEMLAIIIDDMLGDADRNLFRQALNHRIGNWPHSMPVLDLIQFGSEALNMTRFSDIWTIPEQDDWMYNTTRYGVQTVGKSQVCNVFVCNMWKSGGVYSPINNDFQCGEQTLWGLFSLNIFDTNRMGSNRPQLCQTADPNNELCQLMGNMTFHLKPYFNTRTMYKNMGNACPSKAPDYVRPHGC